MPGPTEVDGPHGARVAPLPERIQEGSRDLQKGHPSVMKEASPSAKHPEGVFTFGGGFGRSFEPAVLLPHTRLRCCFQRFHLSDHVLGRQFPL